MGARDGLRISQRLTRLDEAQRAGIEHQPIGIGQRESQRVRDLRDGQHLRLPGDGCELTEAAEAAALLDAPRDDERTDPERHRAEEEEEQDAGARGPDAAALLVRHEDHEKAHERHEAEEHEPEAAEDERESAPGRGRPVHHLVALEADAHRASW